ncbi:MAG: UDP-N-acetylglucosamine 1-carboxyvinyltransferase [Elusimicrobia bacterium]|nr:UDP-N-acetylglucosamine 1-carboxyvinyltransferase [Elusimicrobiota bacterium]
MEKIVINGCKKLLGEVRISGSKNAALPILIATLLTDEKCVIKNVPELEDINTTIALLRHLGKKIKKQKNEITILSNKNLCVDAPYELVNKMRASVLVAGPLIARFKKTKIALPGGDAIGLRPIDIHLEGFKKFGARCSVLQGNVSIKAKRIRSAKIVLDFPSVGATENLLMSATLINGETIIENAAIEPEVTDLANFLVKMGARISGIGSKILRIKGVKNLRGCTYRVIPDRIETGTFIVAAVITSGNIRISGAVPEHNEALIEKVKSTGAKVYSKNKYLNIIGCDKIKSVDIKTAVYPGFATDLQPLWMALMSLAVDEAIITETIFENRMQTVAEFVRMGANIKIEGNSAIVRGVKTLTGAKVVASDLRAAAALILAGLSAKGGVELTGLEHLDRGYENIVGKLRKLGAKIKRIKHADNA